MSGVGDARGKDGGLGGGLVVVGDEVDGVGVDGGEHFASGLIFSVEPRQIGKRVRPARGKRG